jgi:hypothetical protein
MTGCVGNVKKDEGLVVQQRAIERWNLLIAHKGDKAYDYLAPGYRQTITRDQYASTIGGALVHWQSVKPLDQKCEADSCVVHVQVNSKVTIPQALNHEIDLQTPIKENWIRSSGTWYYLPDSRLGAANPVKPEDAQPQTKQP